MNWAIFEGMSWVAAPCRTVIVPATPPSFLLPPNRPSLEILTLCPSTALPSAGDDEPDQATFSPTWISKTASTGPWHTPTCVAK